MPAADVVVGLMLISILMVGGELDGGAVAGIVEAIKFVVSVGATVPGGKAGIVVGCIVEVEGSGEADDDDDDDDDDESKQYSWSVGTISSFVAIEFVNWSQKYQSDDNNNALRLKTTHNLRSRPIPTIYPPSPLWRLCNLHCHLIQGYQMSKQSDFVV
jgi:hypothetical protein